MTGSAALSRGFWVLQGVPLIKLVGITIYLQTLRPGRAFNITSGREEICQANDAKSVTWSSRSTDSPLAFITRAFDVSL